MAGERGSWLSKGGDSAGTGVLAAFDGRATRLRVRRLLVAASVCSASGGRGRTAAPSVCARSKGVSCGVFSLVGYDAPQVLADLDVRVVHQSDAASTSRATQGRRAPSHGRAAATCSSPFSE